LSSAASLLRVKDKIQKDVILMTGDIIVEDDGFLHHMVDKHRARDAAGTNRFFLSPAFFCGILSYSSISNLTYFVVTVLGYYEKKDSDAEDKKKKEVPSSVDYIGVDQKTDRYDDCSSDDSFISYL
jgi:hypothetical protein